mgnify:FL=1
MGKSTKSYEERLLEMERREQESLANGLSVLQRRWHRWEIGYRMR